MRSLNELKSVVSKLPSVFAADAGSGISSNFPKIEDTSTKTTSYQKGFPIKFAKDPTTSEGAYILRGDVNRLGEMATRELFYRQNGGIHQFNSTVSSDINGYPQGVALNYFDGIYLKTVESQIVQNTANFKTYPYFIDSFASDGIKKWTTANKIYGLDENLFKVEVDFSRKNDLQPGEVLSEDSFVVIGDSEYKAGYYGEMSLTNLNGEVTINSANSDGTVSTYTLKMSNKGVSGVVAGQMVIGMILLIIPDTAIYPKTLCGSANYTMAFFARKGSSVNCTITVCGSTTTLTDGIFAYPLINGIKSDEEQE